MHQKHAERLRHAHQELIDSACTHRRSCQPQPYPLRTRRAVMPIIKAIECMRVWCELGAVTTRREQIRMVAMHSTDTPTTNPQELRDQLLNSRHAIAITSWPIGHISFSSQNKLVGSPTTRGYPHSTSQMHGALHASRFYLIVIFAQFASHTRCDNTQHNKATLSRYMRRCSNTRRQDDVQSDN